MWTVNWQGWRLDGRWAAAGWGLILAVYLALAVQWVRAVPPFEGFDENFHVEYIYYVHSTHQQPEMPTKLLEGMQPPAYYFLMSALIDPLKLVEPNLNHRFASHRIRRPGGSTMSLAISFRVAPRCLEAESVAVMPSRDETAEHLRGPHSRSVLVGGTGNQEATNRTLVA